MGEQALVAHVEFVLKDEFEELAVAETTGGGFLQAHVESLQEAGETQLTEGGLELGHEVCSGSMVAAGSMR